MQKSAPRPKNRIPKATEIMLNAPTISSPAAAVTTKPTHKLTNTARLMWAERSASQRIKSSARTVPAKLGNIPLPSVTNCSSLIATCPGQPQPCAKIWAELQLVRRLPDRVYRRAARLQSTEIESWRDLDESPQLVRRRGLAIHQHTPREAGEVAGEQVVQRVRQHVHRPSERIQRHAAGLTGPDA